MAKFKKLAILCTALVMCAGLATATACSEEQPSSSPAESSSPTESSPKEDGGEEDGGEEDGDEGGGEVEATKYTVTVNKPAGVTVGGELTAEEGKDVVFTLTASQDMFINVSGAVYVSEEVSGDNVVYTYKVSAINRDRTVTVTQAYYRLVETNKVTVNNWSKANLTLDLTPGMYVVNTAMSDTTFGDENAENSRNPFLFEVTEDYTPTVYASYFNWDTTTCPSGTPVEINYSIYEIIPIDLTGTTEGSMTLLGNADIPVSFTAPAAAKYKIASSTTGLEFGIYDEDTKSISYEIKSSQVVTLAEGETINFYIKAESSGESFVFNYTINEAVATPINLGETEVTLNPNDDVEYKFVADKAGDYKFTFVNAAAAEIVDMWAPEANLMFGTYNADSDSISYGYTTSSTYELAEGQEFNFYAKYYYSEATAPITDTIRIQYLAPSLYEGTNEVNANESVLFRAPNDGYYMISAGENETLSTDGGNTWVEEVEVYLATDEEVNIIAKSSVDGATTATLYIEDVTSAYDITLVYGVEQEVSVKADRTYTVYFEGAIYNEEVVITWNNENVVLKTEDGTTYNSGDVFYYSYQSYYLTTVNGEADTVTLFFNGKQYPALALGENKISVEAETPTQYQYAVVADALGKYTFTVTGASISDVSLAAKQYATFVNEPESLSASGSLSITMIAGDMLYLTVTSTAAEEVTVNVAYEAATFTELVMGDNTVASLKSGEAAFFKTTLDGKFLATWNSNDYTVCVVIDGNYSYDEVEFSNDGTEMYVIVTNTGDDLTDFVLNVAKAPTKFNFEEGLPVYLEIPAGESVIAEGYLFGTYQVTWDETVTNLQVTCNGVVLANGDTFTYSNYYHPCQLVVTTTDGAALNTRILVEEYVAPAQSLVVGDNTVEVTDGWNGVKLSFTATEAGTYTFTLADGETNGDIYIEDAYGGEWVGFPYSVTLEANETFSFILGTLNMNPDTIEFVITKESGEGGGEVVGPTLPESNEDLKVGDTTIYMIHEDGHSGLIYFTPEEDGTYTFSVEGAVVKTWDSSAAKWVALTDNKLEGVAETQYWIRVEPNDSATTSVVVTITKEGVEADPDPVTLNLGANAVAVPANKCVKATFTAEEDGDYRIKLADGEANAVVKVNGETIVFPSQYTLKAGDSVEFEVWSSSDADDTIDLVMEKYTGSNDPSTDDDDSNWTQNY